MHWIVLSHHDQPRSYSTATNTSAASRARNRLQRFQQSTSWLSFFFQTPPVMFRVPLVVVFVRDSEPDFRAVECQSSVTSTIIESATYKFDSIMQPPVAGSHHRPLTPTITHHLHLFLVSSNAKHY